VAIDRCTKADFDFIRDHIAEFWGSDRTLGLHHPMFLYEFGDTAYVIRGAEKVVAYLLGLFSQTGPVAYVHLVGVHETARRRGFARVLYEQFAADARAHGCTELKAITTPENHDSIGFHQSIGMTPIRDSQGSVVTANYAGPGQDRVVLWKALS